MNDAKLVTIEQLRGFMAGAADLSLTPLADAAGRYRFIKDVLKRFNYPLQNKAHKGLIRRYLRRMTGYSRPQVTRLVAQYLATGRLVQRYGATPTSYARKFTPQDTVLLAEIDSLHGTLSGPATRVLLERAYTVFGQSCYARLAGIAVSPPYHLRAQPLYQNLAANSCRMRYGMHHAWLAAPAVSPPVLLPSARTHHGLALPSAGEVRTVRSTMSRIPATPGAWGTPASRSPGRGGVHCTLPPAPPEPEPPAFPGHPDAPGRAHRPTHRGPRTRPAAVGPGGRAGTRLG